MVRGNSNGRPDPRESKQGDGERVGVRDVDLPKKRSAGPQGKQARRWREGVGWGCRSTNETVGGTPGEASKEMESR